VSILEESRATITCWQDKGAGRTSHNLKERLALQSLQGVNQAFIDQDAIVSYVCTGAHLPAVIPMNCTQAHSNH
jgi:hypothetical protein